MKDVVIAILIVVALIELALLNREPVSDYWFNRCVKAEDVIYRVYEDNDIYVLDVLSESNEWDAWVSIASQQEKLG